jgi:hypothetical protein
MLRVSLLQHPSHLSHSQPVVCACTLSWCPLPQVNNPNYKRHTFDGDGMVLSFSFQEGRVRFRNKYVRTQGFLDEQVGGWSWRRRSGWVVGDGGVGGWVEMEEEWVWVCVWHKSEGKGGKAGISVLNVLDRLQTSS